MFYVEEIHKPVNSPQVELHIEGMNNPLRFKVKSPAATAVMDTPGSVTTKGWSASGNAFVSGPEDFAFTVEKGTITLLPYKITLVSKSQIEIRPMSELDVEYARGQFAMHPDLKDVDIIYPEIAVE